MVELAVEARQLGKAYRRYASPRGRALELASCGLLRRHALFWALREVDLSLERGCMLGVVGANGAGKSTLLKVLAGTSWPSAGAFRVRGRVASLLELGAGFHPDLSGRENVALAARLAGLGGRRAAALEGPALEFAGLEACADEPVRTYSSGMALRLGFAVATAAAPEVLLLDEVLAVGDLVFQERCVERVLEFKRRGVTIVFASHSLYDVRQLCDRALWIDAGRPARLDDLGPDADAGDPDLVTNAYAARQRAALATLTRADARDGAADEARRGELPHLESVEVLGSDGAPARSINTGAELGVRVRWRNPGAPARRVQLGVALAREDGTIVAAAATHHDGLNLAGTAGTAVLRVAALPLLSGRFRVLAVLFDGAGVQRWDERCAPGALEVLAGTREVGLVRLEHAWRLEPRGAGEPAGPLPSPAVPSRLGLPGLPGWPGSPGGPPPAEAPPAPGAPAEPGEPAEPPR